MSKTPTPEELFAAYQLLLKSKFPPPGLVRMTHPSGKLTLMPAPEGGWIQGESEEVMPGPIRESNPATPEGAPSAIRNGIGADYAKQFEEAQKMLDAVPVPTENRMIWPQSFQEDPDA